MNIKKRKILYITYHFPPSKKIGAIRARGFAKYLPAFGWDVIILTALLPDNPDCLFNIVETHPPYQKFLPYIFNPDLRERLKFMKGPFPNFFERIYSFFRGMIDIPDSRIGWLPFAVSVGKEIMKKERPQAIVSNFGPATCHIIASHLKKLNPNIFWLADFRDPWTQFRPDSFRTFIERHLEYQTLQVADAFSIVSDYLANALQKEFPNKPVYVIPNGFDPDEISPFTNPVTEKFIITHTGSLHPVYRSPENFFKALANLICSNRINKKDFLIQFYGDKQNWVIDLAKKFDISDIVRYEGFKNREEILNHQRTSQILLLFWRSGKGEEGTLTGKVFEYLAARRPILSIGKRATELVNLLYKTNAGIHCNNIDEMEKFLHAAYSQWQLHGFVKYMGIENEITKYSHLEMARKFSEILNNV
ncbi:MAG TPA: glycosyltransferase [bacterium]|nr:glycosyltransferase [bacterium]HOL34293.1 glycosyltransferase [bacterium]HPP07650.1 glycosyltransferase [bacterium]